MGRQQRERRERLEHERQQKDEERAHLATQFGIHAYTTEGDLAYEWGIQTYSTSHAAAAALPWCWEQGWPHAELITFEDRHGRIEHCEIALDLRWSRVLYRDGRGLPRRYGLWRRVEQLRQDGYTLKQIGAVFRRSPSALSQLCSLARRKRWNLFTDMAV